MGIFSRWFGGNQEEPEPQVIEVQYQEIEDDQEYETPEQKHQRLHAGICPGCGHPIDDHPRGFGMACDEWY